MPVKKQEYGRFMRIAWNESSDRVVIEIPDRLKFPSDYAWVTVLDCSKIRVSPNPPKDTTGPVARLVKLGRKAVTPGCRILAVHGVKLAGEHFGTAPTTYETVGQDYIVHVPPEDKRRRRRHRRSKAELMAARFKEAPPLEPEPEPEEAAEPVTNGNGNGHANGGVRGLLCWSDLGLPDDALLEIPLDVAIELGRKYGKTAHKD